MKKEIDPRKWFVLVVYPRAEKQVSQRLSEAGIENFLPIQRQLRIWHDRKKWVDVPLFSSYIFVKTEERFRSQVFEAGGIVKYVTFCGKLATLSENEIQRIHRLCEWLGEIAIEQGKVKAGDEVEIFTGHFKGLRGEVLDNGNRKQLRIAIEGLGCVAIVKLDSDIVRKAICQPEP